MRKRQIYVLAVIITLGAFFLLPTVTAAATYRVKRGDSLYLIAKKFNISVREISQANGLQGTALKPNQILSLPENAGVHKTGTIVKAKTESGIKKATRTKSVYYTVKKGDTIGAIAEKTGVSQKQLMACNNIRATRLRIGQKLVLAKKAMPAADETSEPDVLSLSDEEDGGIAEEADSAELQQRNAEELLGNWSSPDERKLLIKVATGFLGAPYRLGGSTVRGIDCSAFVRKMYEFFDITLPRTAREQSAVGVGVGKEELVEGDLVFFRTRRPVGHVGIYMGNNEFVHASSRGRVVRIDSLETPYFQKRFVRAVRVKGLNDNSIKPNPGNSEG